MSDTTPSRIAFGSCNDHDQQNNLWPLIAARNPAAFIWGGDSIYADIQGPTDWSSFPPATSHVCATPPRIRSLYRQQREVKGYRTLLQQNVTIFGTFDDHDYGCNNADRAYEFKYESGLAFVDFIGATELSAMRQRARAGEGVYGVKLFDFARPVGHQEVPEPLAGIDIDSALGPPRHPYSNQTVAVFVLDVRTHKTPWKKGSDRFQPDHDGDFLGEQQWQWFEKSIRRSNAAVNVVVNGLQVHANRFPDGNVAESWSQFPLAQQRLFDTVLAVETPVVLISGDVHMAQLMRKDCVRKGDGRRRSLVEMTTSGMTHSWGTISTPLANLDYQPSLVERYQSFVAESMIRMLHFLCPWTDVMNAETASHTEHGGGEGATRGLQFSLEKNFGELEFDWEERVVRLRAMGENPSTPPLLMAQYSLDQLAGRSPVSSRVSAHDFALESATVRHSLHDTDWVCVNHRGRDSPMMHMLGHVSSAMALIALVPLPLLLPAFFSLLLIRRWSKSATPTPLHPPPSSDAPKKPFFKSKMKMANGFHLAELIPYRFKAIISFAKHQD